MRCVSFNTSLPWKIGRNSVIPYSPPRGREMGLSAWKEDIHLCAGNSSSIACKTSPMEAQQKLLHNAVWSSHPYPTECSLETPTKQEASAMQQPFWWAGLHYECQPGAELSCLWPELCPACGSSQGNHRACASCCDSVWEPKASNTYHRMRDGQSYTT